MSNIGVFTLWMIERHRAECDGGDWTAGVWHPVRREAAPWSVLMLAWVNLSMLVTALWGWGRDSCLTLGLAFNCLLIHLFIAYWIKGGFYSSRKGKGACVFVCLNDSQMLQSCTAFFHGFPCHFYRWNPQTFCLVPPVDWQFWGFEWNSLRFAYITLHLVI